MKSQTHIRVNGEFNQFIKKFKEQIETKLNKEITVSETIQAIYLVLIKPYFNSNLKFIVRDREEIKKELMNLLTKRFEVNKY